MNNSYDFGNRSTFGIRYIPGWATKIESKAYANLNLFLGGEFIGNPKEVAYVPIWHNYLGNLLKNLNEFSEKLNWSVVQQMSTEKQFNTLIKSNQLTDEFDPKYFDLPILDSNYWICSKLVLDETIDDYLIFVVPYKEDLKFIWTNETNEEQIKSITVNRNFVFSIIEECLETVDNHQYYKLNRQNTRDNKR